MPDCSILKFVIHSSVRCRSIKCTNFYWQGNCVTLALKLCKEFKTKEDVRKYSW